MDYVTFKKCDECNLYNYNLYLNEFNECNSCEKCKKCWNQRKDYLNKLQICDSCCKQMEQMTPSGFKPNFEFEYCEKCWNQKDYLNEFQICDLCCKQMEQITPSGFKPNFKFEYCKGICSQRKDYLNEFNECDLCEKCKRCWNQRRDYLNEFQVCNSCNKQMEEVKPNGFKPNLKFERCKRCYYKEDYLNEFQICSSCYKLMTECIPNGFKLNFKLEGCKKCCLIRDHLNEFNECNSRKCNSCKKCKRCNCKKVDLSEFQICNLCYERITTQTPSGFKPNFKSEKCRRCNKRKEYFNEFQICVSCCKQMKQRTPSGLSGFKPNFKFERCNGWECYKRIDYLNEFNECNSCEKCKRCNIQKKDYLKEFQICNSCYEQITQMIPDGFKLNVKFEKCKRCYNQKRDYLNEFQICNSCCDQIEKSVPSDDFKPNFKFVECNGCNIRREYLNEFQICNLCYEQVIAFIPSGNSIIDDFIKSTLGGMEFVPYDRFQNVEFIAEGGFSRIYKATWIDGPIIEWNDEKQIYHRSGKMTVALKELNNSKNFNSKELNELKIFYNFASNSRIFSKYDKHIGFINRYYGITQHPITQNFMIIAIHYESGDLAHYIANNFFNISWANKLGKLYYIITGLNNIHGANIVHKDYHSGNIFLTDMFAVTGDLGISKSAIEDDDNEIYGIVPYIAPEIFQRQKYTKASDIYSFGMIMWELMTGRKPFWDQNHDTELIIKICDGFRPQIVINAPKGYIELMQKCWHSDPKERPTASD